jgi:hypothetical protein
MGRGKGQAKVRQLIFRTFEAIPILFINGRYTSQALDFCP